MLLLLSDGRILCLYKVWQRFVWLWAKLWWRQDLKTLKIWSQLQILFSRWCLHNTTTTFSEQHYSLKHKCPYLLVLDFNKRGKTENVLYAIHSLITYNYCTIIDHYFQISIWLSNITTPFPWYMNPFSWSVSTNRGHKIIFLPVSHSDSLNNLADNYIVAISSLQHKAL